MKLVVAALVLFSSFVASAQDRIVSIDAFDLAYTGGLVFRDDSGGDVDRDETTFKINLNYAQNLEQYIGLMWKAKVYFNREDIEIDNQDSLESRFGAAGGALYNFQDDDIKNSIFTGAMVGIERMSTKIGNDKKKNGWNIFFEAEGGKRWDLGQYSVANISYAPTIALKLTRYGGDIRDDYFKRGTEVKFNFLKFDILF